MLVKQVEDLAIYQLATDLAKEIHQLTDKIPNNWNVSSINQIKRSSLSVCANITEGFCQRFYPKKFLHYLYIALGSSDETKNHLYGLYISGHISNQEKEYYANKCKTLSIKILNLVNYLRRKHRISTARLQ